MAATQHSPVPDAWRHGTLLILPCPGRRRPFRQDVASLRLLRVSCLLGLAEPHELAEADRLGEELGEAGIEWLQMPVPDFGTPPSETAWQAAAARIHTRLDRDETVAVHCWGGLGRSGMVAARLLRERGRTPTAALARVRRARPGAVETSEQEAWIAAGCAP